ncbi:MAG: electron transport complex subunit RsxC [Bacillota bacterium]
MRRKSFRGGVHPPQHKEPSCTRPILEAPLPNTVVISLTQHLGAPNEPLVKPGDTVRVGQKIGDSEAFVAAPVHASVSGRVVAVEPRPVAAGGSVLSVVIEREGDEEISAFAPPRAVEEMGPSELRAAMREAGLVGMGGAGFPTHVKYAVPPGKKLEYVILNAAECEPYLTCDHRLLCEETPLVLEGLLAMMRAAEVERGFIGIEENKPDAIEALRQEIRRRKAPVELVVLAAKYPQGEERMLIKAILGREVPRGGLPIDVGVVVNNVATAAAFAEYLRTGKPLISRVITVTGLVARPQNVRVRIGTLLSEVVELCGGLVGRPRKLIFGGPMTGPAGYRLDVPVTKALSGLLVQGEEEVRMVSPAACIRCGRCLEACPYGLVPAFLATYVEVGEYEKAEEAGLLDCRECGSCAFVCPSRRPLTQIIKEGKATVLARKKEEAAKSEAKGKETVATTSEKK